MEGLREIATAYYERSSDREKESAEEFFRKLDVNGDGKVSVSELKKSVGARLSNEKIFRQLDENGDGTLDFYEVLAVYYMEKKVQLLDCSGCSELLVGPYFSCLLCWEKSLDTFNLCCSCYRGGKVSHEHSEENFFDNHSLLSKLRERQLETEMEELRQIAKAHRRVASPQVQALAYDFFTTMDTNEDGRVDLSEFLSFMGQQGYPQMDNRSFFNILDHDDNGTLDFSEVMTLYYIIKSGRPFCRSCGNFIPGVFFSCVECFKNSEISFNLCRHCYCSAKCTHNHDGRAQFLDSYALLETKRGPSPAQATCLNSNQTCPTTSNANGLAPQANVYMNTTYPTYMHATYHVYPPSPRPNYSNAIVPVASPMEKWKIAIMAFETALSIGNIAGTMCTIL